MNLDKQLLQDCLNIFERLEWRYDYVVRQTYSCLICGETKAFGHSKDCILNKAINKIQTEIGK